MENLLFLGVPILKHIRVIFFAEKNGRAFAKLLTFFQQKMTVFTVNMFENLMSR